MSVEDLSASLEDSALDSSLSLNPEKKEHPRFSRLYKNASRKTEEQRKRRERILREQKDARHDFQDLARNLLAEEAPSEEGKVLMDVEEGKANPFRRRSSSSRPYKDLLMLSEWLLDVPMDFGDKWLAVPCPVGKRNLVVAGRGKTQFYSRGGAFLGSFPSHLPGGKRAQGTTWKKNALTLLDCVYHEESLTFYVLDVILWDGMPFNECDTELRAFWVRSKMAELSLGTKSKYNPHPFLPLPYSSCSDLVGLFSVPLAEHFGSPSVGLDGILFYHGEALYRPGPTPLVGWLKGYMVPELIPDLEVHPDYTQDKPIGYSSMKTFIQDYNSSSAEKKKSQRKIFTFVKDPPPPEDLNKSGEKLRSFFDQKEAMSVEKAMEFWTLG